MSTMANNNTNTCSDAIDETIPTPDYVAADDEAPTTWVDTLTQLDRELSKSLLGLVYYVIDIVLLSLGLYYGTKTCNLSNALAIISILILVFSGLGLTSILIFFLRNRSLRHTDLFLEEMLSRYYQGYIILGILNFLRLICILVSTFYVFTSKVPINNDCEILRFYLGIVCAKSWILMFIAPSPISLPIRRPLILECFLFLIVIIYCGIYFGMLIFPTIKTQKPTCVYNSIEDLYFHAPLKSFAYVGLILIGVTLSTNIFNAIFNQIFYRRSNFRRAFLNLSAIPYLISYVVLMGRVYYLSVGMILLFQPRSGGSCAAVAPDLYKTLRIWQIVPFVLPFIIWPLACLLGCLGLVFGACLARCLPASIAVPLFEMLHQRTPNAPTAPNPNPPASPGTIDALPIAVFGQASDEFNQSECTICRTDFEANEEIKRLPCGHLFHKNCVANWLSITRICPVCRRRITPQNL